MFVNEGFVVRRDLENSKNNGIEQMHMRILKSRDLESVLSLQEEVYYGLPNKRVLVVDTKEELKDAIEGSGLILGVFNSQENLIGYRFVSMPQADSTNHLGMDVGLSQQQREKAVHLETTIVKPEYRGNQLQRLTLQVMEKEIIGRGYEHLLCTVSPFNPYSLSNVMAEGLKIRRLKRKYGDRLDRNKGLWRFILLKNIVKQTQVDLNICATAPMEDFTLQRFLLKRGYVGIRINKESQQIQYAPVVLL